MLLSSVARAMFWGARYLERADSLSRTIQGYERLSLDLPGVRSLDLRPLLALVGDEALVTLSGPEDTSEQLRVLVLDAHNPSSVLGALCRSRENFRLGRVVTPPEAWAAINAAFLQLSQLNASRTADVFAALAEFSGAASRIEGELTRAMTRDAAHAFLRIGGYLERSDMLVRSLSVLLEAVGPSQHEQRYDDVRAMGILRVLGAQTMYRRRHGAQVDAAGVVGFMVTEANFPRSLAHCLAAVDRELAGLPRGLQVQATLGECRDAMSALGGASIAGLARCAPRLLDALSALASALEESYFPADSRVRSSALESPPAASSEERSVQ